MAGDDSPLKKRVLLNDFIAQKKLLFFSALFLGIFANILAILIPISVGKYYSLLFEVNNHRAFFLDFLPGAWVNELPSFLWFFLVLVLLWMALSFSQRFLTAKLGELLIKSMREKLFAHQLAVNQNSYDESGFGKYLLRYSGDMTGVRNYLTVGIINFIVDSSLVLFAIFALMMTDYQMTLIVICGVIFILILVFFLNKFLYDTSLDLRNRKSGLLSFVSKRLPLMLTIKSFNRQTVEINEFNKKSRRVYNLGVRYQFINTMIAVLIQGLLFLTICAVLVTIYIFKTNDIQIGGEHLLSFILIFLTVLPVFRKLLRVSSIWKIGNISFNKLEQVFKLPEEHSDKDSRAFVFKKGKIRLKDMSYSYGKKQLLLDNVNIKISGGITTLISSPSGLPKSTLIKLITGIYPPTKGKVLVDDQDVSELDLKSLRKKITILSDDYPLLGETVFEASSYSKSKDKELGVEELLNRLQKGIPDETKIKLNSKIGDRGQKLTEAQRQVVIMARCILTNKPIIIIENLTKYSINPVFLNFLELIKEFQKQEKTIVILEENNSTYFDEIIQEKYEI